MWKCSPSIVATTQLSWLPQYSILASHSCTDDLNLSFRFILRLKQPHLTLASLIQTVIVTSFTNNHFASRHHYKKKNSSLIIKTNSPLGVYLQHPSTLLNQHPYFKDSWSTAITLLPAITDPPSITIHHNGLHQDLLRDHILIIFIACLWGLTIRSFESSIISPTLETGDFSTFSSFSLS